MNAFRQVKAEYKPGFVEKANLTVLKTVKKARYVRDYRYEVRWECCGLVGDASHPNIKNRELKKSRMCQECGRLNVESNLAAYNAKRNSPKDVSDYGVVDPSWPVPPSVELGKHTLWGDRTT